MKESILLVILALTLFWSVLGTEIMNNYLDDEIEYTYYPVVVGGEQYYLRFEEQLK